MKAMVIFAKSKSHHSVVHLHPLTNVSTKYELTIHLIVSEIQLDNIVLAPDSLPTEPQSWMSWVKAIPTENLKAAKTAISETGLLHLSHIVFMDK